MLNFNDFQTLITSAEAYYYLGYAVIPLLGDLDPARPKVAARPWSAYQHRLATLQEINDWFTPQGGAAALGIVTGHVSQLAVLDFDSPDLYEVFRRKYPDLVETRTIQSAGRALPHLYFHLPSHLRLASQKRQGVDLLSDGRYVVAPPTTINGQSYRVTRGGTPHTLTAHDLSRLQSFLQSISSIKEDAPTPTSIVGTQHAVSASTPLSMQWRGAGGEDDLAPLPVLWPSRSEPANVPMGVGGGVLDGSVGTQPVVSASSSATNTTPSVGEGLRPSRINIRTSLNSTPIKNNSIQTPLSMQWRGAGGEDVLSPLPVLWPSRSEPANVPMGAGGGIMPAGYKAKVSPTRADLHRLYAYWRSQGGRNDALFKTALYARDHGLTELQTRRALAPLHVCTPSLVYGGGLGRGLKSAADVSPAHRQREAYATIHSAFSRPPRLLPPLSMQWRGVGVMAVGGEEHLGLPNTLREALLQRKMTFVVRTLEGLLQSGIRPRQGFTTDQALNTLKGIVGRDSIYNALNALAPDGQPIFPQRPPSALPQASKEAATDKRTLKTKKCFFVTKKNSGIKKRGVKQRRFKFPTIESLCKRFGVQESASDPLTRDDLASAHRTRMALHRELIKRRPAEYSRRWLANRIGVTRRTLDTYNRLIPIHIQPTYHQTPLSWNNIDDLLTDEILSGAHLETLMGKKYPALKAVAAKLIARGTYIRLMQRKSSFYWYGSNQPTIPQTTASPVGKGLRPFHTPQSQQPTNADSTPSLVYGGGLGRGLPSAVPNRSSVGTQPALSAASHSPSPFMERGLPSAVPNRSSVGTQPALSASHSPSPFMERGLGGEVSPAIYPQPALSASHSPSPFMERGLGGEVKFRRPLPDAGQESLAQTLYTRVNACGNPTTRHLSLGNARKLVHTYPAPHIHAALNRLQQRTNLANPTGFFVTVLRSSARQNE